MAMRSSRRSAIVVYLFTCFASSAGFAVPYDVIRYEATCPRLSDVHSLRQTVVVIDEAIVASKSEANQQWTRAVVDAVDARESSSRSLGVKERVTILVARKDGSEVVTLFLACSSNVSADEAEKANASDTVLDRFLGRDSAARNKGARDEFANALAKALAQLQRRAQEIDQASGSHGSIVQALRNSGKLADLNQGIPRIILVTPLHLTLDPGLTPANARVQGFAAAEVAAVDFGRAEVYVMGATLVGSALEYFRSFILGSKGVLVGVRSDNLPRLQGEPAFVANYAGFIDYVGQRVPVQLRFARTTEGDLVNSWIETTLSQTTATPIGGKAVCTTAEKCEIRGDGRFAQVWLPDPQAEPSDRTKLPFGGARQFEMHVDGRSAKGQVSDSKFVYIGEDPEKKPIQKRELTFEIERRPDMTF